MSTIPVICDRCRSTGIAGQSDFSHLGDLLDFAPVPRKTKRADGWTPEKQRAFIAALSATGSKRQAASAIGMAPFGVDQMLRSDGNDSFKAAYDRAMVSRRAIRINRPTRVVLNHLDHIDWKCRTLGLTNRAWEHIRHVEQGLGCSVDWVGTSEDQIVDLSESVALRA